MFGFMWKLTTTRVNLVVSLKKNTIFLSRLACLPPHHILHDSLVVDLAHRQKIASSVHRHACVRCKITKRYTDWSNMNTQCFTGSRIAHKHNSTKVTTRRTHSYVAFSGCIRQLHDSKRCLVERTIYIYIYISSTYFDIDQDGNLALLGIGIRWHVCVCVGGV